MIKDNQIKRCAKDNPDLPPDFIKECLLGKEQAQVGDVCLFEFRDETEYLTSNPTNKASLDKSIAQGQCGEFCDCKLVK